MGGKEGGREGDSGRCAVLCGSGHWWLRHRSPQQRWRSLATPSLQVSKADKGMTEPDDQTAAPHRWRLGGHSELHPVRKPCNSHPPIRCCPDELHWGPSTPTFPLYVSYSILWFGAVPADVSPRTTRINKSGGSTAILTDAHHSFLGDERARAPDAPSATQHQLALARDLYCGTLPRRRTGSNPGWWCHASSGRPYYGHSTTTKRRATWASSRRTAGCAQGEAAL